MAAADEPQVLRTIDWRTVFPFTQLFRAFRIAIHPAKIVLALLAILLIYSAGRVMDTLWTDTYSAVPGEVSLYANSTSNEAYAATLTQRRMEIWSQRREMLNGGRAFLAAPGARVEPVPAGYKPGISEIKTLIEQARDAEVKKAKDAFANSSDRSAAKAKVRDDAIAEAYQAAANQDADLRQTEIQGLGITFLEYESARVDEVTQAILSWNWFTPNATTPAVLPALRGFVFTGPSWAITKHPLYFIPMTLLTLLVWSVIGGAIARLAAVHVAQDEKISVRHALRFSTNKLMSFFAAPIMPLLLVGIIALLVALIGWLSEIPYLGGAVSIIVGFLFVILIGIGVLVACAVVGTICGFGLMYPTIAVEGSDAFDAVSRSFSYVFARPWKILVYSVIALVYAAITYVFLRFMCYLTLSLLHSFLTLWTHHSAPDGYTSLATSWPAPTGVFELVPHYDGFNLTTAGSIAYGALIFWVYLFVGLLAAYLLSYFVSVNTIMYYLLRYDVDATDLDDVYLEPSDDEDFEQAAVSGGLDPAAPLTTAPATALAAAAVSKSSTAPLVTPPPAAALQPATIEPAVRPADALPVMPSDLPAPTPPPDKPHGDPVG